MFDKQRIDDAVSPVVGVILMVAVTVILAAVIGSFVLDLGNNVQANPQAGVTFDEDSSAETVSVQVVSMENADSVYVVSPESNEFGDLTDGSACAGSAVDHDGDASGETEACELTGVGQSATVSDGVANGGSAEQVTIIGVLDGKEAVLQTYSYDA